MTLLAVCISEHRVLTVLEQAAVVGCRVFVNFMNIIGYKPAVLWLDQDWWRWPSSTIPLLLFPHQDTSFSSSCIRLDAGLISVETKPPSSKQQGHTVAEAVTRSTMQLVQASFPHGQSCCSGFWRRGNIPEMCSYHVWCEAWLTSSANSELSGVTSFCNNSEVLTHLCIA
eukprot:Em0078g5a